MDEGPRYEHRRMIPVIWVTVVVAVVAPGIVAYRGDLAGWLGAWPVHLVMWSIPAWHWFMFGRHVNRHVRVDDSGLWVDRQLRVRPRDIVGLGLGADPVWTLHMRTLHGLTDGRRRARGGIWSQRSWVDVIEAPGFDDAAAVTRQKDLARGSATRTVIVQTTDRLAPGHREAWNIASYRSEDLLEALLAIAPHAQLPQGRPAELEARLGD